MVSAVALVSRWAATDRADLHLNLLCDTAPEVQLEIKPIARLQRISQTEKHDVKASRLEDQRLSGRNVETVKLRHPHHAISLDMGVYLGSHGYRRCGSRQTIVLAAGIDDCQIGRAVDGATGACPRPGRPNIDPGRCLPSVSGLTAVLSSRSRTRKSAQACQHRGDAGQQSCKIPHAVLHTAGSGFAAAGPFSAIVTEPDAPGAGVSSPPRGRRSSAETSARP